MSRYLIDTHVFIWQATDAPQLSAAAQQVIDSGSVLLLSHASVWEMAIKVSIGKLSFDDPFSQVMEEEIRANRYQLLPFELAHSFQVSSLPFHHKDPFDRFLIAQSLCEGIPILSADENFDAYGVQRIW